MSAQQFRQDWTCKIGPSKEEEKRVKLPEQKNA